MIAFHTSPFRTKDTTMLDPVRFPLFILASLSLLLIPGPAVLYIVTRSIDQGRLAGVVSVLGIEVGGLFHVAAAALGISAILVSSALAFSIVKYLGAAYLIYLGVRKLLTKNKLTENLSTEPASLRHIFSQGVVVNVLNPKTALFFFAFLPQFVNSSKGSVPLQMLLLGGTFIALATVTDGLYAILSGTFSHWLKGSLQFLRFQRYFAGTIYIGLGLVTALSGSDHK
jgi:threonine/homoserine/homoserine lactone efflux protein